jgi:hypothetical protein
MPCTSQACRIYRLCSSTSEDEAAPHRRDNYLALFLVEIGSSVNGLPFSGEAAAESTTRYYTQSPCGGFVRLQRRVRQRPHRLLRFWSRDHPRNLGLDL